MNDQLPDGLIFMMLGMMAIGAIWGIASDLIKRWGNVKEQQLRIGAAHDSARAAHQAELVQELSLRVKVLERIVTDKSSTLAAEIEDLREPVQPADKSD